MSTKRVGFGWLEAPWKWMKQPFKAMAKVEFTCLRERGRFAEAYFEFDWLTREWITVESTRFGGLRCGESWRNGIQSLNSSLTIQSAGSDEPVHPEILNTLRGVWTEGMGASP